MTSRFIFDKAEFASCHASTIVESSPGKLLAAWFGGTGEGKSDVKIWLSRFDGTNWSNPEPIAHEPGVPCWNPVLFRPSAGTMWLWYKVGPNPMGWSAFIRRSKDDGATWEKPEQNPAGLLGPIRAKPIRIKSGAILAGTSVESYRSWTAWVERSTDEGKSWRRFGPIQVPGHPYGIIQPTLFETNDGRIVAMCRSRGLGVICRAESKDGGETWSDAVRADLPNPGSGIDVVKLTSGDLILIYNHSRLLRTPLNLARSTDDGKTWTSFKELEQEPGEFSYPAIIQTSDGKLNMTYTWNRTHIKHATIDPPN
jgi:predicted neuraminidase